MEEEEDGDSTTPFWVQSSSNNRLRRSISSIFFSSGLVVFILLVTAVLFLVFILPTTLSFTSQILRPNSVKKSWDSLNIALVLVAIVFGFLSRIKTSNEDTRYDESQSTPNKHHNETLIQPKPTSTSDQWFNYNSAQLPNTADENKDYSFLERNGSSYPDLREFSSNRWDYRRGFYDDLNVDASWIRDPVKPHHRRHRSVEEIDTLRALPKANKTVFVDTLVAASVEQVAKASSPENQEPVKLRHRRYRSVEEIDILRAIPKSSTMFVDTLVVNQSKEAAKMSYPPPTPTPPPVVPGNHERVVRKKGRKHRKNVEPPPELVKPPHSVEELPQIQEIAMPPRPGSPPPPPLPEVQESAMPPPPPPPEVQESAMPPPRPLPEDSMKRTGSATKEILNSLYHKKKKKKPRQKSLDNIDSLLHQSQDPLTIHLPPPSLPAAAPPPSTSTVFQNLFLSKKQKRKRTISVTLTPSSPPPPPPPPPPRKAAKEPNKPTSQHSPLLPHKPPPNAMKMFEENTNSGGESPMNRIPPPPPPPPPAFLKNPSWKFVVHGDYVRVDSSASSRSGSSEMNDVDTDVTPSAEEGGVTPFHPSPLYCPSPDVNSKAESFITNFRAKLKLEKIHSMNGRQLGLSGLGPGPGPTRN